MCVDINIENIAIDKPLNFADSLLVRMQTFMTAQSQCVVTLCVALDASMCKIRDEFDSAHHWIFQRIDVSCQSKSFESVFAGIFCQLERLFTFDTQTYTHIERDIQHRNAAY